MEMIGVILMNVGLALAVYSFVRYLRKQKLIKRHRQNYSPTSQHHSELYD
jgi:putative membrane protein